MNDAPRPPAIIPTVSRPAKPLEVRLATIARALVVIATLAILAACYIGKEILAPMLLALLLSPFVALVERTHAPRMLASGITVVLVIGIAIGSLTALAQPARDWIAKA